MKYGMCLLSCCGVAMNTCLGLFYLNHGADGGDVEAQFTYASVLEFINPVVSVQYHRLAASQGHAGSQNALGLAHLRGSGTDVDEAQAVDLFRLSVAQGHLNAMNNLEVCLLYGRGGLYLTLGLFS
jgi:TPR repeat protein